MLQHQYLSPYNSNFSQRYLMQDTIVISKNVIKNMLSDADNRTINANTFIYNQNICFNLSNDHQGSVSGLVDWVKEMNPCISTVTMEYILQQLLDVELKINNVVTRYSQSLHHTISIYGRKSTAAISTIISELHNEFPELLAVDFLLDELCAISLPEIDLSKCRSILYRYLSHVTLNKGYLEVLRPYITYEDTDEQLIKRIQSIKSSNFNKQCACPVMQKNYDLLREINPSALNEMVISTFKNLVVASSNFERISILRSFFKVGCLNRVITSETEKVFIQVLNMLKLDTCSKCPAFSSSSYTLQQNQFGFPATQADDRRLSKVEIKAYLYYNFLCDNNGIASDVDLVRAANTIGCCTKALLQATTNLSRLGYLNFSTLKKQNQTNCIHIYIIARKTCHLSAKRGGTGYIVISKTLFEELVKLSDILQLRLILKALLEDDNTNYKLDNSNDFTSRGFASLNYKDAPMYLGSYLYTKKVKALLETIKDIFEVSLETVTASIKLKVEFNGKSVLTQAKEKLMPIAEQFVPLFSDILTTDEDKHSIVSLLKTYSPKQINEGLSDIRVFLEKERERFIENRPENINEAYTTRDTIHNLGGYLRQIIRRNIHLKKVTLN